MRVAIGIDFGTESGRAVMVDVATGAELATAVHAYANGVIDRRLPAPDDDVVLEADWALQDPADYVATVGATVRAAAGDHRHRPRGRHRHRHRLHLVHDAPDHRRRHAAVPGAGAPPRAARLGQALEAPRRAAGGGPHQRAGRIARRGVAAALRRPDLVGVVLRQEPPDPRRGAARLPRGGPADRGGRLDRVAAHRVGDPQRLHRGLQGPVVEARRLPRRRVLRRPRARPGLDRRRQDVAPHRPASARWPAGCPSRRRAGRACARGRPSRSPTSTPTSRSPPSASRRPGRWSR